MTIQIRGTTTLASANATSRTITPNFVPQEGDLLLLQVGVNADRAITSVPEGFTLVDNETGTFACHVYQKVATASEPADYTILIVAPATNLALSLIGLYSDDGDNAEVDAFASRANASALVRSWPQVVTTVADTLLLCFGTQSSGVRLTPQGGMTERWDYDFSIPMYLMTGAVVASGATGERTASHGSSTATSKVVTIAVKEVTPPPPEEPEVSPRSRTSGLSIGLHF